MSAIPEKSTNHELPKHIEQLELSFKRPRRPERVPRGQRPRFTKEEEAFLKAAAYWCAATGNTYKDVAEVLSWLIPRPVSSIQVKMSRLGPRKRSK